VREHRAIAIDTKPIDSSGSSRGTVISTSPSQHTLDPASKPFAAPVPALSLLSFRPASLPVFGTAPSTTGGMFDEDPKPRQNSPTNGKPISDSAPTSITSFDRLASDSAKPFTFSSSTPKAVSWGH
jgi:hypothetical protein